MQFKKHISTSPYRISDYKLEHKEWVERIWPPRYVQPSDYTLLCKEITAYLVSQQLVDKNDTKEYMMLFTTVYDETEYFTAKTKKMTCLIYYLGDCYYEFTIFISEDVFERYPKTLPNRTYNVEVRKIGYDEIQSIRNFYGPFTYRYNTNNEYFFSKPLVYAKS